MKVTVTSQSGEVWSKILIQESNFETSMTLSQGLITRCLYCFKIRHYYILNML